MYKSKSERNIHANSGPRLQQGCGAVGRGKISSQNIGQRQSLTSLHRTSRPQSGSSHNILLPGGWTTQVTNSRPGSARQWAEKRWQQQEKQEIKKLEYEETNNNIRTAQFRADFFNARPSAPRCVGQKLLSTNEEEQLKRSPRKVYSLSPPRSPKYNEKTNHTEALREEQATSVENNKLIHKSYRSILGPSDLIRPEVLSLKQRLEELRSKNSDERKKLNEELSYRAWKNNNEDARKMESERLGEFVRSAWVDQKQWRQDELKRKQSEDAIIEEEAVKIRGAEDEKEKIFMREKQRKREECQRELEEQIKMIKQQDKMRISLIESENWLLAERDRVLALEEKRKLQLQVRKSKNFAITWSKQNQIKLRQRAAQVLEEVAEDEALVKEMLKQRSPLPASLRADDDYSRHYSDNGNNIEEHAWVLSVLAKHKRLEQLRQQEYDMLFSEEAARLFQCRDQQWQQEQRARESLIKDVLEGRREQFNNKLKETEAHGNELTIQKQELENKVADVEKEMKILDDNLHNREICDQEVTSENTLGKNVSSGGSNEEEHRKEIHRLEREMALLWGPMYKPPCYGRKKSQLW